MLRYILVCKFTRVISPGGGVLPYMGYIGVCSPKEYGFSAVLVINRVWFLHCSLDMGMFFGGSYYLHKLCLGQLCRPQPP